MTTTPRRLRALALLMAAVLAMAACSSTSTTTTTATDNGAQTDQQNNDGGSDDDGGSSDDGGSDDDGGSSDDTTTDDGPAPTTAPTAAPAPTDPPADTQDTSDAPDSSVYAAIFNNADSDDFCDVARFVDENDPFDNEEFDFFGEEFFEQVLFVFEGFANIAPNELQGAFAVLAQNFSEMQAVAEEYDYNFFSEELGTAMDQLDSSGVDEANAQIETYLEVVCGIDTTSEFDSGDSVIDDEAFEDVEDILGDADLDDIQGTIENLDDEDLAALNELFLSNFNLDEETAQCLLEELPDLTAAATDPAILTQPICGTTLLSIISGTG